MHGARSSGLDSQLPRVRGLADLDIKIPDYTLTSRLRFDPADEDDDEDEAPEKVAPWTLFLGENAVGKSSVLEAITLALIGKSGIDALDPPLVPVDLIRRGRPRAVIELKLAYSEFDSIKLRILKRKGFVFDTGGEPVQCVLRAYSHVRLSPKRGGSFDAESYRRVENLFDPTRPLCEVNSWFKSLPSQPDDADPSLDTPFDRAAMTIKDVLPESVAEPLEIKDDVVKVQLDGEWHSLQQLSAGYQGTVVLAADIMSGIPPDKLVDMKQATGIILLDEVGSQLHPKWRMHVVRDLRRAFPNIQFITTTHEPLCLRGVATDEVVVLRRDEPRVTVFDPELGPDLRSMRVDQLLTSPFFGLHSTIDPEIDAAFQKYYALLERHADGEPEPDELVRLRGRLSRHNTIGYTRRDQLLYNFIDDYLAEHPDATQLEPSELSPETRKELLDIWLYASGRFDA